MEIPADLNDFLNSGGKLEYDPGKCECGRIELLKTEDLENCTLSVELAEEFYASPEQHQMGPWGTYNIEAINLVKSCEHYDPEYILLYLPKEKLYGSFDSDHLNLIVFPNTIWSKIISNPLGYINAQWGYQDTCASEPLDPRGHYAIKYENT
ncbi:MAG: hypothetical protein K6L76_13570 [Agarilytica sp.]